MTSVISIDFETCSVLDLKRVGVFRYVEHPSTDVTCAAYALPGDVEPRTWIPIRDGYAMPADLRLAIATLGAEVHAWNAGFERSVFDMLARRHRWLVPRAEQWHCSMARAAYWGFPASLEMAGEALQLAETKQTGSRAMMLRMSRPRELSIVDGAPTWWHRTDARKLDELVAYCVQDVIAERAVARALPPLPPVERACWLLDQQMNRKGIDVDLALVEQLSGVVAAAAIWLGRDMVNVTGGAVRSLSNIKHLQEWLAAKHGVVLESMKRDSLEELHATMPPGPAKTAIGIRLDGARTSTSKLKTLTDATCSDGTVKGLLRYFGAGRTGRWSGAGGARVQPQNLPRPPKGFDAAQAIRLVQAGVTADDLSMVYAHSPMTVASSCLRGCFVAPPGKRLVVADFAQIEARVLASLAGQQDILDVFASGQDVYTYDARAIGSSDRQLGKTTRLGLGFQMGAERFVVTAATYDITLTLSQAQRIVEDWREANPRIVGFWYKLDDALRTLVDAPPDSQITVGPIRLLKNRRGVLLVYLPNGRPLVYRELQFVKSNRTARLDLVYRGVNPLSKRWDMIRFYGGKLTENLVQATARDVMRDAMLAVAAQSLDLRLTVHDELIAVADEDQAPTALESMLAIMRRPPTWLPSLPVAAAGYVADRYRKG